MPSEYPQYVVLGLSISALVSSVVAVYKDYKETKVDLQNIQKEMSYDLNFEQKVKIYSKLNELSRKEVPFSKKIKSGCLASMSTLEKSFLPKIKEEILTNMSSKNLDSFSDLSLENLSNTYSLLKRSIP